MNLPKPPLGVLPRHRWEEYHPEPTLREMYERYRDVSAAVGRYHAAGADVPKVWLKELGVL